MSLLRALIVSGGLLVGTAAATGTASAQSTYPTTRQSITISDPTAFPGQELTATATDLDPGTSATGTLNSTPIALGTKIVPASGTVSFSFRVPSDFVGAHSVTIQGTRNGAPITLNVPFTVAATDGGTGGTGGTGTQPRGNLVRTGAGSTLPLGQAGIALLAIGGGAVCVAKRRRRVAAPTA